VVDEAAKIAIFRIIQEAVNNVLKHSEAKHVHILMEFTSRGMRATVRDDGCGFDVDKIRAIQSSNRPSLGLAGMQERAALLGGEVGIQSRPEQGTLIEAFIPYRREKEATDGHAPAAGG
jgi:signal transduction histidine kinase